MQKIQSKLYVIVPTNRRYIFAVKVFFRISGLDALENIELIGGSALDLRCISS